MDYLQLLQAENPRDNRVQQVGTAARRLKHVARQTGVPIICLRQLNRQVEERASGKPRLSDLRESGEIEQHADAVSQANGTWDRPGGRRATESPRRSRRSGCGGRPGRRRRSGGMGSAWRPSR
ncbi:DnaB-like helicase C-terminal domain-containing protein [Urbifossiella limnaea]|uniref:DnaB-like helicase C-terminal domain-containing protein n=1 Tax=Urbifossiella limnaea TaxID=2528023 RepID=UPI0036F1DDF4